MRVFAKELRKCLGIELHHDAEAVVLDAHTVNLRDTRAIFRGLDQILRLRVPAITMVKQS